MAWLRGRRTAKWARYGDGVLAAWVAEMDFGTAAPIRKALYAAVEIDEIIPPAHYEAVAKIIGFILSAGRTVAAQKLRNGDLRNLGL